jgi:hypothetical protein
VIFNSKFSIFNSLTAVDCRLLTSDFTAKVRNRDLANRLNAKFRKVLFVSNW